MNPQSQVTNTSPADPPLKRKRGRPRKDESLVQGENTSATPGADSMKKDTQSADTTGVVGNEMVGQLVSGVIEGSFDAGYLLKVKVGDTDTHLRGVVFLPGLFTPITASNDVAPQAKMYRRTEMPIPVQNPPAQVSDPVPPSEQCDKQAVEVQNLAPIVQVQGLTELQSAVTVVFENQPASDMPRLTDNLPPMSSTGSSLESIVVPHQILESGPGSLSAAVMPQMGHDKVAEPDEVQKEFEAFVTKTPNANVEAIEQSKSMPQSTPSVDSLPGSGTVNFELQIQHQSAGNDFKPSQPDHEGGKIQNLEHNQAPIITEPVIMPGESIGIKTWMEKQASPVKPAPAELSVEIISGNNTLQLNGKPASHAVNVTEAESKSASMTGLPVTLFGREAIASAPKLANEGSPLQRMIEPELCISSGATNIMKADSAPVTSLPVTLFEKETVPSGPKLASDGPVLPRITELQSCSSSGVGRNVECNLKDAIPPAES